MEHRTEIHGQHITQFREVASGHRRAVRLLRLDYPNEVNSVQHALVYSHPHVLGEVEKQAAECGYFKMTLILNVEFIKMNDANEPEQSIVVPFRCETITVMPMQDPADELTKAYAHVDAAAMEFVHRGSGWIVNDIMYMDFEVSKCRPLAGSCFSAHTISYTAKSGFVIDESGFLERGLDDEGGVVRVGIPPEVCI